MTNPEKTDPAKTDENDDADRLALEDLDAGDDADKVTGGSGDPCMGGELHRR
jgi:hypothetical protein